jgi:hypothetical protein
MRYAVIGHGRIKETKQANKWNVSGAFKKKREEGKNSLFIFSVGWCFL